MNSKNMFGIEDGMIIRFEDVHDDKVNIVVVTSVTDSGFYFGGSFRGWKTIKSLDILTPTKVI